MYNVKDFLISNTTKFNEPAICVIFSIHKSSCCIKGHFSFSHLNCLVGHKYQLINMPNGTITCLYGTVMTSIEHFDI